MRTSPPIVACLLLSALFAAAAAAVDSSAGAPLCPETGERRAQQISGEVSSAHSVTEAESETEADRHSSRYIPEEIEIFGACGLRPPYELDAWIMPRMLGGDLDGDGSLDSVAPVRRHSDGARGLAVCRAGTYLHLLGFDGSIDSLEPAYFAKAEAWAVKQRRQAIDYAGAPPLPEFDHDVIAIERIEKSSYTIYWQGDGFRARRDYRVVTGE